MFALHGLWPMWHAAIGRTSSNSQAPTASPAAAGQPYSNPRHWLGACGAALVLRWASFSGLGHLRREGHSAQHTNDSDHSSRLEVAKRHTFGWGKERRAFDCSCGRERIARGGLRNRKPRGECGSRLSFFEGKNQSCRHPSHPLSAGGKTSCSARNYAAECTQGERSRRAAATQPGVNEV